jgi:hypothetical protein
LESQCCFRIVARLIFLQRRRTLRLNLKTGDTYASDARD